MTVKIKARIWLDEKQTEPIIADVMNPGGWFGTAYIVQITIANALNPFLVIEAANQSAAINTWADDEQWGHLINDDESQDEWDNWDLNHKEDDPEPEWITAGNDGHCVNLDNVRFCKFHKIEYFVELDKNNWTEVAAIADAIQYDKDISEEIVLHGLQCANKTLADIKQSCDNSKDD